MRGTRTADDPLAAGVRTPSPIHSASPLRAVAVTSAFEPELRERGISSAAVFGSVVRGQATPDSDVDVLVDIDPAAAFDLFDLVRVNNLLADRLGRAVDVVEKEALKPRIRDSILAEAGTAF
jgi:predicted nucleotidyltransferase